MNPISAAEMPYMLNEQSMRFKIRNRRYSQGVGREELFERERSPDVQQWDSCTLACAKAAAATGVPTPRL
jgi:hypothetical protein